MPSSEIRRDRPPTHGLERTAARGFTLLEVLAAVALLAILYTVLARSAIEGLRAEGESERRLEASLLADTRLRESFEGAEGSYAVPPLGHSEVTEGDFTIILDVSPFEPPGEWGIDDPAAPSTVVFAPPTDRAGPVLRTIQLSVAWLEGAEQRQVTRTAFALDFQRVAALIGAIAGVERPPGTEGSTETSRELEEFEQMLRGQSPSELEAP
jgi:prepilin-type N-terminal cleavage/methylation domain-containing protein